jgi:type I restriction enzyme R subunit
MSDDFPFRVFDPNEDTLVIERLLPHWSQAGTISFITFRSDDSMPKSVVEQWRKDRMSWLRRHTVDPTSSFWKQSLEELPLDLQNEFRQTFSKRWHDELDACHGACVLRQRELARIVADSLKHFDGVRYILTDFVVMPNHVHLLAAFHDPGQMLAQCESWKHYTAVQINRRIGGKGRFWQQDGFDHLVRSIAQFEWLRRYIRLNPEKARLLEDDYLHESKPL